MNKEQLAVIPGSPDAARNHCSCTGETYSITDVETGEVTEGYLYSWDCKLHGLPTPENTLPDTI